MTAPLAERKRFPIVVVAAVVIAAYVGGYCTNSARTMVGSAPWPFDPEICWHIDGSRYECPDSADATRRLVRRGDLIESVALQLVTSAGDTIRGTLPRGVDAIFLTPDGLRILQRHYVATDAAKAAEIDAYLAWDARQP